MTSTDVRYVPGQHDEADGLVANVPPKGLGIYHPRSRVASLVANIVINDNGIGKDALIGFFTDDAGASYFLLMNMWHGEGASAEARSLSVTLTFAPSVTILARLSRSTGQPERVLLVDNTLTLTLPGGTGDLFKIGDAEFPGIEASSEGSAL